VNGKATVFVVDDDRAVRASLQALAESAGLSVETFASGEEFLASHDPQRPGCVVLDLRLGAGADGLEVQDALIENGSRLPVIVLTAHGKVPDSVRAMKAGAFEFLQKPVAPGLLLERILDAVSADADRRSNAEERAAIHARVARLTPREHEIANLIAGGRRSKDIVAALGISLRTVEAHRRAIYTKMQISSVAELVTALLDKQHASGMVKPPR
jgi:FixJ family two-component response regulator